MALVYNNTTIPENGGKVIYNGVDVDKVVYNGTTIWQKVTEKIITDITDTFPNWRVNYITTHSDSPAVVGPGTEDISYGGCTVQYGGIRYHCHTAGEGECWLSTGLFSRVGYNKLSFLAYRNSWSDDCTVYIKISNNAFSNDRTICDLPITTKDIGSISYDNDDVQKGDAKSFDITINDYFTNDYINIILGTTWGSYHNAWKMLCLYDFKLYN